MPGEKFSNLYKPNLQHWLGSYFVLGHAVCNKSTTNLLQATCMTWSKFRDGFESNNVPFSIIGPARHGPGNASLFACTRWKLFWRSCKVQQNTTGSDHCLHPHLKSIRPQYGDISPVSNLPAFTFTFSTRELSCRLRRTVRSCLVRCLVSSCLMYIYIYIYLYTAPYI